MMKARIATAPRRWPGAQRRDPAISGPAPRQEILEGRDRATQPVARDVAGLARAGLDCDDAVRDGIGQRERRSIRRSCERLGCPDGNERPLRLGGGDLGRLEGDRPIAAAAAAGHEPAVEVLDGGLRVERDRGVLELVGAQPRNDVG